jgi:hypothetical protein
VPRDLSAAALQVGYNLRQATLKAEQGDRPARRALSEALSEALKSNETVSS